MENTTQTTAPVVENRNEWRWGFTPQAEIWNGRLAMLGFTVAIFIELFTDKGVLHFLDIL
ncbi:MAG: high light inducible protein [Calothrix sp. C42_A2020_038]|nr:high light inducible protein [Calothrix sp. C42_A2020_038]